MRARDFYSALRTLHAFTGAALCLLLIVLALTGSLLVFKDDYVRARIPAARAAADLSLPALARAAERAEAEFGDNARSIIFARPRFALHKVYLKDGGAAYLDREGHLVDRWEKNGRVEDWLFDLHHYLLAGETGKTVSGVAGLGAGVLALTGLFAFWPARRAFRRGLRIENLSRPALQSAHRNLGILSALPIVVLALTGAAVVFSQTSIALFDRIGGSPAPLTAEVGAGDVDWEAALAEARDLYPDAAPRVAGWPASPGDPARLRLKRTREWHPNGRTSLLIDPADSTIAAHQDALSLGAGRQAWNGLYPIHAAHTGGRLYDLLVFASGLALAGLGFLGLAAFIQRFPFRRRRERNCATVRPRAGAAE